MFVQLLGMAYGRDDGRDDEAEGDDSKQLGAARVAHAILRRMKRVPGEVGQSVYAEKLQRWVVKVRSLAASCGRAEVGDVVIGELLAGAAGDMHQSHWPARAICQVMEAARADRMGHGFVTGIRNARGAMVRAVDEGGPSGKRSRGSLCGTRGSTDDRISVRQYGPWVAGGVLRVGRQVDGRENGGGSAPGALMTMPRRIRDGSTRLVPADPHRRELTVSVRWSRDDPGF